MWRQERQHQGARIDALAIDLSGMKFWTALLDRYLGLARTALGETAADAAWDEDRRTGSECAIALALDVEALAAPLDGSSRTQPERRPAIDM